MAGATSKLSILIDAKNNASSTLKQVESDAGNLGKSLTNIAGAFGIAFGAQAVVNLAEAGVEMARAAAEAERLGNSFEILASQAGQSADAMLSAMQEASHGTISNSELMLQANTAMMLGIADSSQEMAQLLEVASARGKAFGVSTADAFAALTEGLGRMSPEILNNIGIVINAQKTYADYADQIGRTVESLTDQEKKQALVNAVIQSSTSIVEANKGSLDDAATSFERLAASADNAKIAIGEALGPGVGVGVAILTGYLDGQTKMLKNETDALNAAWVATKNFTMGTNDLTVAQIRAAEAEGKADDVTRRLTFGLNGLAVAAADAGQHMRALGADALAAMEQFNIAMQTSQSIMSEIGSAATQAGVLFAGKQGGDAGLAKQKAVTEELQGQVKIWKEAGYTEKEINDVLLPGMVQSLNEADRATFKVATGTAKISDEAREAQQAFDELTNTVSGVLSGALDPGVGVDPADLLPRQDAINEDARRLADIAVNGWASPWAEYFKNEFPDQFQEMAASNDIKTGAAIMLRNFQDGLEPELISKEKAKERVRKILIGDANMAALATEIATELSQEMGVPMQQALAATQETMGGGMGMGTEAATSFSDAANAALDQGDGGGAFVSKFSDQMRAKYSLLATAGTDAAKTWGDAFLARVGDSVPPALINLLTDLVTPQVVNRMAQQGSLTRAVP